MQRPPRLKRWSLKIAACLLAGAVITWAVAWGCAIYCELPVGGVLRRSTQGRPFEWPSPAPAGWPAKPAAQFTSKGPGITEHDSVGPDNGRLDGSFPCTMLARDCGWPLRSMRALRRTPQGPWPTEEWDSPEAPWLWRGPIGRRLPIQVLPLGFVTNTLLTSAVLFLTFTSRGVVRGWGRRPGHCPVCGYDRAGLASDAACPECGGKA
ncbi:MAG TPA: hypothetical protein VD997_16635 [Phycisphaerales bacterium]|nr:hypothetical protein [Phycisphaerales bacterium]